jgi:hypothetical protein
MRIPLCFLIIVTILVSCGSLPQKGPNTHIDHGIPRDPAMQYESIQLTYKDTPWLRFSNSWKRWPESPQEIVIQGMDKEGSWITYWGNSEIRNCSWKGFIRIGKTENALEVKYAWHKYPTWRMSSFRNITLSSDIPMKVSFEDLECQLQPGDDLPKKFISLIDNKGTLYEGRAVLEPNYRPFASDDSNIKYPGSYVMLYSRQKYQFTDNEGKLLGESMDGILFLSVGLSDEQRYSIMMMASIGEIIKHFVGKYY